MKRFLAVFAKALAVAFVSLICAEITLKFLPAKYFQRSYMYSIFGPSSYNPYTLNANAQARFGSDEFEQTVRTNALGLRDIERSSYDKPSGTFRVLALGDSFTLGHGVELPEIYSRVLVRTLTPPDRFQNVDVVNAGGASCYSQDTEYLFLKNEGLKYQPDLVLVQLFVYNDILEIEISSKWDKVSPEGLPEKISTEHYYLASRKYTPVRRFFYAAAGKSRVISKLNDLVAGLRYKFFVPESKKRELDTSLNPNDDPYAFLRKELTGPVVQGFEKWKRVMLAIQKLCQDNHAQLLVMLIPADMQVDFAKSTAALPVSHQKMMTPELAQDWAQQRLLGFFKEHGIEALDLLPAFRQQAAEYEKIYYPVDKHWRPYGHELAARVLAQKISQMQASKR